MSSGKRYKKKKKKKEKEKEKEKRKNKHVRWYLAQDPDYFFRIGSVYCEGDP